MLCLYTIKLKSEALEAFRKFKVLVEKESEKLIKILRTDGSEISFFFCILFVVSQIFAYTYFLHLFLYIYFFPINILFLF